MQTEIETETQAHAPNIAPPAAAPHRNRDRAETAPQTTMRVTKRDGSKEAVDLNKIVRAVSRCCVGLDEVDALRVATKTISGLYDGATTSELDRLSIQTAAALITEEPHYGKLAARLLSTYIDKEVRNQEIHAFSQSILTGHRLGLINARLADMVARHARKLNDSVVPERDREFEYFGLRTVYDRYLLRHPETRLVIETPQQFFLRIACALSETPHEALELYRLFSTLEYLPSSPTLFNSGTSHEQLSSCFLLDSPADHLESIYQRYTDVALLSKFSGGIGLAYHRVRSRGSLIESTNGHSNGIVPWLKTLDASVSAVNQGGKRKGAACVYLEPWHADIEAFLELRDNTGDESSRTHNLNLANWIPDLFMRRVEANAEWSLFDPKRVPELPDLWGEAFERAYEAAEAAGLASKTMKARDLYARMMRVLAQTGNGWMTFKDASNRACNQTALPGRTVHLSNLCTEIIEVTSSDEAAVCNLGSINLARHVSGSAFDFAKLARRERPDREPASLGGLVGALERLAPQVGQLGYGLGIEQAPRGIGLDAPHEQIRDPVREVEVVGPARLVAGVVAQREERLDVGVPGLEVDARRALALAALVDRGDRRVERLQPRHDPARVPVGALDQRAARPDPVVRQADPARELRQQRHVRVALVDRLEVVGRRVEQEAAR